MQNPQREIDGVLQSLLNTQDPNVQKKTMIRCFTQDVALRSFFCNVEPHKQSREDALGVYQWLRIISPNTEFDTTNIAFNEDSKTLIVEGKILLRFRFYPILSKPANCVVVMKLKKNEGTYQIASQEYYIHPDQFINIAFSPLTPMVRLGLSSMAYTYAVGAKFAQVLGIWRINGDGGKASGTGPNGTASRNGNRTASISSHSSDETRIGAENNYSGSERGGERQSTSKKARKRKDGGGHHGVPES
ncbi:hypothetical protein H0H92_003638 [Tricholoma furcatifolium]|nr:hypothetical protein H0H92_003638 [Tricholoma furcatifolium]